jgi:hypothetical protein
MLRVAIEELIRDVRITLDENANQSAYIKANRDNLELDEIIREKLPEAARDITEAAPIESLEPDVMETEAIPHEGGGILTVPDDFLRIVSLKMKGWSRSVTAIADEGSDIELMQRNKYTKGTTIKPVCVFVKGEDGKKAIEYFGDASEVERALYMPIPIIESVNGADVLPVSRLLRQAIVRRTAGLVLLSRGDIEQANSFLS